VTINSLRMQLFHRNFCSIHFTIFNIRLNRLNRTCRSR